MRKYIEESLQREWMPWLRASIVISMEVRSGALMLNKVGIGGRHRYRLREAQGDLC